MKNATTHVILNLALMLGLGFFLKISNGNLMLIIVLLVLIIFNYRMLYDQIDNLIKNIYGKLG